MNVNLNQNLLNPHSIYSNSSSQSKIDALNKLQVRNNISTQKKPRAVFPINSHTVQNTYRGTVESKSSSRHAHILVHKDNLQKDMSGFRKVKKGQSTNRNQMSKQEALNSSNFVL